MNESMNHRDIIHGTSISSLISGYKCIRRYYFEKRKEWKGQDRYTLCKLISSADKTNWSEETIWNDLLLINPEVDSSLLSYLHEYLIINKDTPLRPWTDLDIEIRSKKFGLYGMLDKFDVKSGQATFVRCTKAPSNGCWAEDRIRAASLQICIEETLNIKIKGINVEYIPSGIVRYYEPGVRDRRIILQLIKKIHMIDSGIFPEKPANAPCSHCLYNERCNIEQPKILSEVFKKS